MRYKRRTIANELAGTAMDPPIINRVADIPYVSAKITYTREMTY